MDNIRMDRRFIYIHCIDYRDTYRITTGNHIKSRDFPIHSGYGIFLQTYEVQIYLKIRRIVMSIFSSKPQPISEEVLKSLGFSPVASFPHPFPDSSTIWIKEINGGDLNKSIDLDMCGNIIYYPKNYKGTIVVGSKEISLAGRCKLIISKNICKEFISESLNTNIQLALWVQEIIKKEFI